jgi:outer membrane protein OmpA-like peptidoglycan-associated protein
MKRGALVVVIALFLALAVWEGKRIGDHRSQARAEARRLVGSALAGPRSQAEEAALYARARDLDPTRDRAACARGRGRERQGQWAAAADAYRACIAADPELAYAHFAYAQALLKAYGAKKSALEARNELRRFAELAEGSSAAIDPATRREARDLIFDLEDVLGQGAAHGRGPLAEQEILEILTRPQSRGFSRYEGPRAPLRFTFRPGDAELGREAEGELREVAKALRKGVLVNARIRIEGHADSVEGGSRRARLALSRERAEAVKRFLVESCGIPGAHLSVKALADDYPLTSNETGEGRTANRRVELVNLEEKSALRMDVRDSH